MSVLEVANLKKSYGRNLAVNDVSFSAGAGEIFALLGPNGAGKSTTMMMIAGLLQPDNGTISIDGDRFNHEERNIRGRLGIVPQDLAVYSVLTARENLHFYGGIYGLEKGKLTHRVKTVLDIAGLTDYADSPVQTYSGGMKRRLNFAVALLHEPQLLILDEPTVGVDPQSRAYLLEQVKKLSGRGMCVIFASHYMEEVQTIADRVAIMDHGRIIAIDFLSTLLNRVKGEIVIRTSNWSDQLNERFGKNAVITKNNGGSSVTLSVTSGSLKDDPRQMGGLLSDLADAGVVVESIDSQESNLETLFLELTGHALRD